MTLPYTLTLVAGRDATVLTAPMIEAARELVRGAPAVTLSPGEAADIPCPAPSPDGLDLPAIRARFAPMAVDVLLTRSRGRRKGLLVADMDSTIVTGETLDELADHAGLKDEIAAITARSMNGEIDFATALRERVAMLRGLNLDALAQTWRKTSFSPGARTLLATMKAQGATTALVSGGFTYFTERVASALGFDIHRANTLLDDGATLTGAVAAPILDRDAKLATLNELAAARGVKLSATLAVGDGANDLAMLQAAGLGIAYHAKPVVAAQVPNQIRHTDLRSLLFAQGYPANVFQGEEK